MISAIYNPCGWKLESVSLWRWWWGLMQWMMKKVLCAKPFWASDRACKTTTWGTSSRNVQPEFNTLGVQILRETPTPISWSRWSWMLRTFHLSWSSIKSFPATCNRLTFPRSVFVLTIIIANGTFLPKNKVAHYKSSFETAINHMLFHNSEPTFTVDLIKVTEVNSQPKKGKTMVLLW